MPAPTTGAREPGRRWLARAASGPPARRAAALVCGVGLWVLPGCAGGPDAREAEPASYEARSGVPLLMDLPGVGWLFQRRVVAR